MTLTLTFQSCLALRVTWSTGKPLWISYEATTTCICCWVETVYELQLMSLWMWCLQLLTNGTTGTCTSSSFAAYENQLLLDGIEDDDFDWDKLLWRQHVTWSADFSCLNPPVIAFITDNRQFTVFIVSYSYLYAILRHLWVTERNCAGSI